MLSWVPTSRMVALLLMSNRQAHLLSVFNWYENCCREQQQESYRHQRVSGGCMLAKSWAFCATDCRLDHLAARCTHPPHTHASIAGRLREPGESISAASALYPDSLAETIAVAIQTELSMDCYPASIPWQRVHRALIPPDAKAPTRIRVYQPGIALDLDEVCIGRGATYLPPSRWANPFSDQSIW